MLNLPNEVEQDVVNFLAKLEHLDDEDSRKALRLLIAKYLNASESDFLLTKCNLFNITSQAKTNFVQLPAKVYLDGLENRHQLVQNGCGGDELRMVSIIQAVIGELSREKILCRPVKFNFKKR